MFDVEKARAKGMPESSIKIMQQINENNARRDSCTGHHFEAPPAGKWPVKHVCTKCGYEADVSYVLGYQDACKHLGHPVPGREGNSDGKV
jgi:hypothetical protein